MKSIDLGLSLPGEPFRELDTSMTKVQTLLYFGSDKAKWLESLRPRKRNSFQKMAGLSGKIAYCVYVSLRHFRGVANVRNIQTYQAEKPLTSSSIITNLSNAGDILKAAYSCINANAPLTTFPH